jgi:hypothetical protein
MTNRLVDSENSRTFVLSKGNKNLRHSYLEKFS